MQFGFSYCARWLAVLQIQGVEFVGAAVAQDENAVVGNKAKPRSQGPVTVISSWSTFV